jgi:hypothetical protein
MHNNSFRPALLYGQTERLASSARFAFRSPGGTLEAGPLPLPDRHPLESSGAGLCRTARDYAKFLQGLMQGKLLGKQRMEMFFMPRLDPNLQKSIMERMANMPQGFMPLSIPRVYRPTLPLGA